MNCWSLLKTWDYNLIPILEIIFIRVGLLSILQHKVMGNFLLMVQLITLTCFQNYLFSVKRKSSENVIRPLDSRTKDMCSNPDLVVCTKPSSQPLHNP